MPESFYNGRPIRRKYKHDAYPNLRRTGLRAPSPEASRRTRMIYKALLRATRRWDTYATKVRKNRLDGEASAKTIEWRLIIQNGRLLRRLRKMKKIPERWERFAQDCDTSIHMPPLPFLGRAPDRRSRDLTFGE